MINILKKEQIENLNRLREGVLRNGRKMTIVEMIREAVDEYIEKLEDEANIEKEHDKEKR